MSIKRCAELHLPSDVQLLSRVLSAQSSSPARKRKRSSSELRDVGHSDKENIPPSKYKRARMMGELDDHIILNLLEEDSDKRFQFEQRMVGETQAIRREIERLVQHLIGAEKDGQD
jgi:hypothetical protein